jgi:predicted Zn-dependent peptidase
VNGRRFGTLLCLGALLLPAQELRDYERKVSEFTLANGLHFILMERHQVPVVSFHTYINAGSAQDPTGRTGLANLLSRMAFDGTEMIGTRDWPTEKKALEDVELAFDRMDEERDRGFKSGAGVQATLQANESAAVSFAFKEQNRDEYTRAIQENGGVRLDSHVTPDSLEMSYSLPSNRIELWFVLESQRFAHPVFRNFYIDRQKQAGDAMHLLESGSPARVRQALLATAFDDLPYRNPELGWPGEVNSLRVADAKSFLDTYGSPANTVIAIVGDVDPAGARQMAERYFGPIPARPRPPALHTQEASQAGPKTAAIWSEGQPFLMIGYKRPPETNRDDAAFDLIAMILGDDRTGWLHQQLVEEKQIAQSADAIAAFPAARYTNLFVLSIVPARDHSVEENRKAVDEVLARLQNKPVDAETLTRAKNVLHARFARTLASNQELAALLPAYYADYGDWRKLFTAAAEYDRLTAEDLQRVALQYLVPAGRTVAYMGPPEAGNAPYAAGGQR